MKHMLRDSLGFSGELPCVDNYRRAPGRVRTYVKIIREKELLDPGGRIYVYHTPVHMLKPILGIVNIVALVRDPRDVAVSSVIYKYKSNENLHERVFNSGRGRFYAKLMSSFIDGRKEFQLYVMRYEDVKADTFGSITSVLDHFGYEYDPEVVEKAVKKRSFRSMSEGRCVGEEDCSSHYRKGVIGDWKNVFTKEDCESFVKDHYHIMKEFGYL